MSCCDTGTGLGNLKGLFIHFYTCVNITGRKHLDLVCLWICKCKYCIHSVKPKLPLRLIGLTDPAHLSFGKQLPAKSPVNPTKLAFIITSSSSSQWHPNICQQLKKGWNVAKKNMFSLSRRKQTRCGQHWIVFCLKPTTCSFLRYRRPIAKELFKNSPQSAASSLPQRLSPVSALPGSLSPRRWSAHAARHWGAPSLASLGSAPPGKSLMLAGQSMATA